MKNLVILNIEDKYDKKSYDYRQLKYNYQLLKKDMWKQDYSLLYDDNLYGRTLG